MSFFDKLKKEDGGYIFISHSHKDIHKVRKIRNGLETNGFEPLCFYLKCLDDANEIEELIKREIDAREWFVFVDSENARKSKWVTLEREYINRTNSKKIIKIDINDDIAINQAIEKIRRNLRIFLSYSANDSALADRIAAKLRSKEYMVWQEKDLNKTDFANSTMTAICEAARDGCVLLLITPDFFESESAMSELRYAVRTGGNILPVVIGDKEAIMPEKLFFLEARQAYYLPESPSNSDIDEFIEEMGQAIIK